MLEDGVEERACTLDEPFDVCVAFSVDVRKEEQLLVSLDHETGKVHGPEFVLSLRKLRHQRWQFVG